MLATYISIIRNHVLSVFVKKVDCLPPKHSSRLSSLNMIGWNPLMVIPLLANHDLTPMLLRSGCHPNQNISGKVKELWLKKAICIDN